MLQFILAMLGSFALAVIVYFDASHGEGLLARLAASPAFKKEILNFIPDMSKADLLTASFLIYVFVGWWAATPGSGQLVQRLLSCRGEKDSLYAFLWYNFCNYVVRPWPWIVVGVLSIIYFPELNSSENCYPRMIDAFLPAGLKGIMVASLLAAFMSTVDTWLNCGASYVINDLYRPYIRPNMKPEHYVAVSRVIMLILMLITLTISTQLDGILAVYKYIGVISAGIGTVMIARWYWWRVGPWSEISAMAASLIVGNAVVFLLPDTKDAAGKVTANYFAVRMLINTSITFIVWVTVTLIISKKPSEQTLEFYKKMRISGPGWRKIAHQLALQPADGEFLNSFYCWLTCCVSMFSLLIGSGMLIFHKWSEGFSLLAVSLISTFILFRLMKNVSFLDDNPAG
jgi:SSS family solute:Na+ symporter